MALNRRVHNMRYLLYVTLSMVTLGFSCFPQAAISADWGAVASRDSQGTVLIHVNWVDQEGPQSGSATGFVLSPQGHIITVAHVFPLGDWTVLSTGETEGLPSSYPRQLFPLKVKYIDRVSDFAILLPDEEVALVPVPTAWGWEPREGMAIHVRGFPLGGALEGMGGEIRRSGVSGEVPTSAMLLSGYSGAPVYDGTGKVVCMIRGGVKVVNVDDPTVMGLGVCVPLSLLEPKLPPEIHSAAVANTMTSAAGALAPIRVSHAVERTKVTEFASVEDLLSPESTGSYTTGRLEAEKDYRIVGYEYREHSASKLSDRNVQIATDGSYLEMTYKLTSGPGWDRYRGWLAATIVTIQHPKER